MFIPLFLFTAILKFYGICRVKPAVDQFIDGLKACEVYDKIKYYTHLFKDAYCYEETYITADSFEQLFETIDFSETGSNKTEAENRSLS